MTQTGSTAEGANGFHGSGATDQGERDTRRQERRSLWHRVGYMIGFAIAGYFAFWIMILLTVMQSVFILASGVGNSELKRFSGQLVSFMKEALDYVTFQTDERPFPFKPFPSSSPSGGTTDSAG